MSRFRPIHSLHAGQVAILVVLLIAAGFGAFARLQDIRNKRATVERLTSERRRDLDSLDSELRLCRDSTVQAFDSLTRSVNRAMFEGRLPSSGGFMKPIARNCSAIPAQLATDQRHLASLVDGRERLDASATKWKAIVFLCSVVALGILWLWFEARRVA
jgi:hypothetical protein